MATISTPETLSIALHLIYAAIFHALLISGMVRVTWKNAKMIRLVRAEEFKGVALIIAAISSRYIRTKDKKGQR